MNSIFVGYEYGVDLYNEQGVVKTISCASLEEADETVDKLSDPEHELWVDEATGARSWKKPVYRAPIYGVDYGTGSIKRRFGGYTPRSAYQFTE